MHPLNYSIETATLYEHIYSTWDENSNSKLVLHLLESIKKILLQYGRPTFERVVSADNEKEKAEREQYFQRKLAALKQELKDSQAAGAFPLPSYFEYQDKLYSFYSFCEVFRQQVDEQTFSLLFAFKLREFEEHLPQLDAFLRFHYHINFEEDGQAYLNFLQHLLAFYKEAIGSEEISHHLQQWVENHQDIDEYQRAIQEAKLKKKAFSAKPLHIEEAIIDLSLTFCNLSFHQKIRASSKLSCRVKCLAQRFTLQAKQASLMMYFFSSCLLEKPKIVQHK